MKPRFLIFFILFFVSFLWGQKRPIQFEDLFSMKRISTPILSPDGKSVVFSVKSFSIEENKGQSDLYLVHLDNFKVEQLTNTTFSEFNPVWSPSGKKLAFLSTKNGKSEIYVMDMNSHQTFLAASIPVSVNWFTWSKDKTGFIFTADLPVEGNDIYNKAKILKENKENPVKAHVATKLFYRSWNVWRDNTTSQIYFYDFETKKIVTLASGSFDTPPLDLGSDHDIEVSSDRNWLFYVANKTEQPATNTNNDIFMKNLSTGEEINLTKENLANDNAPTLSPNGKWLAYRAMSRPGFEADQYDLILYNLKTKKRKNLTEKLDLTISSFKWSPNSKELFFISPYHARHRLYKVNINGKLTLLDEGHFLGSFAVGNKGRKLIVQRQAVNQPTELFVFDVKNKRWTQLTNLNKDLVDRLEMPPLEEFWIKGSFGDSIHVLMVKPPFFDPNKKYPLVVLIHGGPQGAFGDDFHYRWNMEMFAAPGYVVIAPNFHGSRGYGQKFCDAVSKNWGGAPYEDIIKATKYTIDHFPFIDKNKVGAAGASYGGFMIDWIEGHNPDGLFKCLISHAGVFDQKSMYGATEELWFPEWEFNGDPYHNPELYVKFSPSSYVAHFKTPCLVIAGEHDYRVPYTQSLQFFTALQKKGVESKLIVFPDEDHFVQKPQNAKFWWENVYQWLAHYLK